jgi:hypothetical protein
VRFAPQSGVHDRLRPVPAAGSWRVGVVALAVRTSCWVVPGKRARHCLLRSPLMEQDQPRGQSTRTPPPGEAWTALSYLLSGFLLFGGIGWGLDTLLGAKVLLPAGLLAGGAASLYLIYLRYVKS